MSGIARGRFSGVVVKHALFAACPALAPDFAARKLRLLPRFGFGSADLGYFSPPDIMGYPDDPDLDPERFGTVRPVRIS